MSIRQDRTEAISMMHLVPGELSESPNVLLPRSGSGSVGQSAAGASSLPLSGLLPCP